MTVPRCNMYNYCELARDDAKYTARCFLDEIYDYLIGSRKVKTSIYDYSDSYHQENHVDKSYNPREAVQLLSDLRDYVESDSGLWDKQPPLQAVCTQAAFTYGNAVACLFRKLMEEINDDPSISISLIEEKTVEDMVCGEFDEAIEEHEDMEDGTKFVPPFDIKEEVTARRAKLYESIHERLEEIIEAF